jgi:mannose-6-phosphate isomerase-like protein (cupin superfamily)
MGTEELLIAKSQGGVPYTGVDGLTCKISSASTGNAFAVLELRLAAGEGAPLHVHRNEDELIYIREGRCVVAQQDREWDVGEGDLVVFPKHAIHAFRNVGPESCTLVITAIPGGLDRYFVDVSEVLRDQKPERVAEINERYGIYVLP